MDDKAQSITVLNVKFVRLSWSKGNNVAKYVVTLVTSRVVEYLGIGVRTLYIPVRSLEISGWDPIVVLLMDKETTIKQICTS